MSEIIVAIPKSVEGKKKPVFIYQIHDYHEGAYYPVNEGEDLTSKQVKKLLKDDKEGKFAVPADVDDDNVVDKLVVAMTSYGCIACFLGCETSFKAFLPSKGIYYPIDEIKEVKVDSAEDFFSISGKIGKVEYPVKIPLKEAVIHYLVSCKLKDFDVSKSK